MLTQRLIGWPTDGCGLRPGTALNDVLQLDIVEQPLAVAEKPGHHCGLESFFGLSPDERAQVRVRADPSRGGRDTLWQNRVQWARSHNISRGLMTRPAADGSEWGIWALSPAGVRLAESVVNRYRELRPQRARSKRTN